MKDNNCKNHQSVLFRMLSAILFMAVFVNVSIAQNTRGITGSVYDSLSQEPLIGVNILNDKTSQGTTTDFNGEFSISAATGDVLTFSYIGYKTQNVTVSGSNTINVRMLTDAQTLDELVVVGYGTQKKSDLTGSIDVVDVDKMSKLPSRSAEHALQGMASGVNVIPSAVPGSGARIFIRGVTNFGNTNPLVIIDGIEQDLNNISAKDIESVQVLKDAGAAAIYGVRGANGVILVTTKKGKRGKPVINYEGSYGMQYPLSGNPFNVLNSQDYMNVYNVAFGPDNPKFANGMPDYLYRGPGGAGVAFEGDPKVDPSLYLYQSPNQGSNYLIQKVDKEGTDWFHELFKKAPVSDHSLSVGGATETANYFFGVNFRDQQGTLVETRLKRYSARVNTEFKIGKNIRIGENANILFSQSPGFSENTDFGGIIETVKQEPIVPIKDIGGNWGGSFGGPALGDAQNPVAVQHRNVPKDINNTWGIIGNGYAELDFLSNFTARTSLGYNITNFYDQNYTATQVENVQASTNPHSLNVNSGFGSTMTFSNTVTYQNRFANHSITALAGSEAIRYLGRSVNGGRANFFSTDFNFLVLGSGTDNITNSSSVSENSLFSLFGRVDYAYNDKYLLSGTIRRDGSSRFGSNSRYGVFPSVSAGWKIGEEAFLQDLSWLDELKLRGSYGVLGSQSNVSTTNAFSLYGSGRSTTYYDINGTGTSFEQGFARSRIGNPNTGWEENKITNVGVDFAILNNTFDFSIEYYKKSIDGLLFEQPLPAVIIGGASSPSINIGDIQNTGLDFAATYRYSNTNGLYFDIGTNITTYKNEIVDIPDPGYFFSGSNQSVGSMSRNEEGYPISSFYGYQVMGLFNSQQEVESSATQPGAEPGLHRFEDINNDGQITPEDRTHIGNPHPDFTYGLNLNLRYNHFDFSAYFYGSQGNEVFNATKTYLDFYSFYPPTNKSNKLLDAWTPQNTNTDIPKITTTRSISSGATSSSYYVEDGSFLKLRSLSLGYNLGSAIMSDLGFTNLRLYVLGSNILTFTKYSGLDPELIGGSTDVMGVDRGSYPNNEKGIYFGINATF